MNPSKIQNRFSRTPDACCPPSIQACKTRSVLTLQQAIHIFEIKWGQSNQPSGRSGHQSAAAVARSFGVNEKTVRDIWVGRTWIREIMHLDPARAAKAGSLKMPGRPTKRSKTTNHKYCQANNHTPCCLCDRTIEFTSDTAVFSVMYAIREGPPDPSSEPPLARMSEASRADEDPFHDDWPHWAAADLWEQSAAERGFIPSPAAST